MLSASSNSARMEQKAQKKDSYMAAPLILIAEDTPDILIVLIDLLELEGYRVHTAGDGQSAWDYLQSCIRCPDLLITDIMMPRMGGIDLIKKIRDDERFKTMPVAMYSASGHYYKIAKELSCHFILKPFDLDKVLSVVADCLNNNKEVASD